MKFPFQRKPKDPNAPKLPLGRRIWRFCWKSALWFFILTISWVILYKWINPPITYLQIREWANCPDGVEFHKEWADADEISLYMKLSVVASEDNNFMKHNGIDWGAVEKAKKYNEKHKGKKQRGASTISQQTAKNVFLWPSRSWIRKGFEVYFTYLIEFFWSKERILEVYLNVIETGPCKFGVEAAAQDYFKTSAAKLTREQSALIAACLPNPKKYSVAKPGPYMQRRQAQITKLTRLIGDSYFERYGSDTDEKVVKERDEAERKIEQLGDDEKPIQEEETEIESSSPEPMETVEPEVEENTEPAPAEADTSSTQ